MAETILAHRVARKWFGFFYIILNISETGEKKKNSDLGKKIERSKRYKNVI